MKELNIKGMIHPNTEEMGSEFSTYLIYSASDECNKDFQQSQNVDDTTNGQASILTSNKLTTSKYQTTSNNRNTVKQSKRHIWN